MQTIKTILSRLRGFLETPFFKLGETQITLLSVVYFLTGEHSVYKRLAFTDTPAPGVRFIEFGERGLEFDLRAWTTSLVHRGGTLPSTISSKSTKSTCLIHSDVHIRSGTIDLGPGTNQSDHGKIPNS